MSPFHRRAATPLGLFDFAHVSQGSSCLATLGFESESRWDSSLGFPKGIKAGGFPVKIRHRVPLIVLVCATLLSSHPALAQFSQQGPKLVGTDAVGSAGQGDSVSVSGDGNTAIVGGFGDNSGTGAVWV